MERYLQSTIIFDVTVNQVTDTLLIWSLTDIIHMSIHMFDCTIQDIHVYTKMYEAVVHVGLKFIDVYIFFV